jgi:alginate O-acetyltransferase complex protein AlgI
MQFNSVEFGVFFLAVLLAYYGLARNYGTQRWVVVIGSVVFYAFWSFGFVFHFLLVVIANYFATQWMDRTASPRGKKAILATTIVLDLANLACFKYLALLYDTYGSLSGLLGLTQIGFPRPEVLLPLGISFYTFHVISYLVDHYRKVPDSRPRDLVDFLFYVTMFSHQIAGPILRGHELFPQLAYKPYARSDVREGFERLLLGLFQKAVIADNLAVIADHGYRNWDRLTAQELYVVLVAYSFQIFFDFAGYSNMGIGSARMLGYRLPENFNTPYISANISEFWRRWHMTLSRWIRDYIFIPLGGSRASSLATDRNLLVTMGLAGLWHGAAWSFVVWGLYHGVGLILHRHWSGSSASTRLGRLLPAPVLKIAMIFFTFHFVTFGWVLFRAPDWSSALSIYARLAHGMVAPERGFDSALLFKSYGFTAVLLYGLAIVGVRVLKRANADFWRPHRRWFVYVAAIYLLLLLIPEKSEPFIYFQF